MEVAGEVCARRGSGGGWVVVLRGAEGGDDCRLGLSGWGHLFLLYPTGSNIHFQIHDGPA